jgi:hypothetical protein
MNLVLRQKTNKHRTKQRTNTMPHKTKNKNNAALRRRKFKTKKQTYVDNDLFKKKNKEEKKTVLRSYFKPKMAKKHPIQ